MPAGDNPVYPDVLLSIRAVRQSLERAETNSDDRQQYLANLLREARTIRAALEFLIEQDDAPLKEHVKEMLDNEAVSHSWFYESEEAEDCFDFDRLDRKNLEQHLSDHEDQSEARYDADPEKESEEEAQDALEREEDIPEDEA